jgi:photosystem II protein
MVAVCCGMAIGAVAVGLRFPRRMPRAFDAIETLQSAAIEFIAGETEKCIPDVKLTRSPDGRVSTAVFTFDSPAVLSNQFDGDMTGMHLKDEEGVISTNDVNARFINGRPRLLVARVMLNGFEAWDRFMRWMDRYAKANGLAFTPANSLAFTPASSMAAFTPASSFSSMGDALHENGRIAYA